jgi:hypothetical protein
MTTDESALATIHLQDIIDYSFCSLRYWWKTNRIDPELVDTDRLHTGEELMERAVRFAILLYYQTVKNNKEATLPPALTHIWKGWLKEWELDNLLEDLEEYWSLRESTIQYVLNDH